MNPSLMVYLPRLSALDVLGLLLEWVTKSFSKTGYAVDDEAVFVSVECESVCLSSDSSSFLLFQFFCRSVTSAHGLKDTIFCTVIPLFAPSY